MEWIAPSEKDTSPETLENRLWAAADELRANSGLTSAQYSQPVLGLIGVDDASPFVVQGYQLLHATVAALHRIGTEIEAKW